MDIRDEKYKNVSRSFTPKPLNDAEAQIQRMRESIRQDLAELKRRSAREYTLFLRMNPDFKKYI